MIALTVNGKRHDVDVSPDMPLLWVLRDTLGLTGTKFGCGLGAVRRVHGARRRHRRSRSCMTAASAAVGQEDHDDRRPVADRDAIRCRRPGSPSRCRSAATASRGRSCRPRRCWPKTPKPTDAQIDTAMTGNICRCGTYQRIRRAIHRAARGVDDGASTP